MLTVMTGWNPDGYERYGKSFVRKFFANWPEQVQLLIYGEEKPPNLSPNMHWFPLSALDGCEEFIARHANKPECNGRAPTPRWKAREIESGYSYKFDAVKFSRQGFIPEHALAHSSTEFLLWLDGDVMTTAAVDPRVICSMLPERRFVSYLGREPKHPDIAFQLYRRGTWCEDFLGAFADAYRSDSVFELKEWHSAFVWRKTLDHTGLASVAHNLTPGGRGHVWFQSPLKQWMDHLKGDRKDAGKSHERR